MQISTTRSFLLLAALTIGGAGIAIGQTEVPAAVKARQGQMQLQSFYLSTLGEMARGNIDYDADAAQASADSLVAIAAMDWDPLWPEGTATSEVEASRALPAIWTDAEGYAAAWDAFGTAAAAVQGVAGGGLDGLRAEMGALGQSCGGCHDDYRVSND
ncbi:c-type cytochrome [Palleronia sediminis]|nr:cytochrome c [Palleronia sediminis]